jgi:DNA mismatch endonuclease (patch repair protein)
MKGNRRTDTRPEIALRRELHRRGLRYRKDALLRVDDLRVRPDIVFPRQQVAVFVDGCFWHGCPEHGNQPRKNVDYWSAKLERNRQRDRHIDQTLRAVGWSVVRIWEHVPVTEAADQVANQLPAGYPGRRPNGTMVP